MPIFLGSHSIPSANKDAYGKGTTPSDQCQCKGKRASLKTTQQRFLDNMDSCISWELATLELVNKATQASLRQIIMAILNPDCPEQHLFYLVNKMYSNNGYIF